ncbi:MAG: hypothetical protein K9J16_17580 [Melioribacteraceae bacterium]|nr:hypothetical protein [Melioribacteraceae bacterium]MCF8354907.1 hypothetical protein [Melioribacteraceae bacterium]MCF8396036.1 hypothetical protein [Melioribacteraceae bacterium]MCF8421057.1 hypothetical protein [Melioribacteraceae bacterium]
MPIKHSKSVGKWFPTPEIGIDWKKFQFQLSSYNVLAGAFLTEKKVFAVGVYGNYGRVIIGSRN